MALQHKASKRSVGTGAPVADCGAAGRSIDAGVAGPIIATQLGLTEDRCRTWSPILSPQLDQTTAIFGTIDGPRVHGRRPDPNPGQRSGTPPPNSQSRCVGSPRKTIPDRKQTRLQPPACRTPGFAAVIRRTVAVPRPRRERAPQPWSARARAPDAARVSAPLSTNAPASFTCSTKSTKPGSHLHRPSPHPRRPAAASDNACSDLGRTRAINGQFRGRLQAVFTAADSHRPNSNTEIPTWLPPTTGHYAT